MHGVSVDGNKKNVQKYTTHGSVGSSLTVGGRVGVGLCCKQNIVLSERERGIYTKMTT